MPPGSERVTRGSLASLRLVSYFSEVVVVLRLDWSIRIGGRLVCTENFIEGVRAVLVDKDHNPKWEPPTLEAVSDDLVDSFFAPLGENELQFI